MLRKLKGLLLAPGDLDICQRVFDQIKAEGDLAGNRIDEDALASAVLSAFASLREATESNLLISTRTRRNEFTLR